MSNASAKIRIGTRGSALARWQAEWVATQLTNLGSEVELVPISTQGDRQQVGPIEAIGTVGVFTKELQRALLDHAIDIAVHSLKDLPTDVVPGLRLAATPARAPVGDALISRGGVAFADLPPGAKLGTGSQRRRAQLWHVRPDLQMDEIRGNVDTRLRKLHEGQYDALILAEAGLTRLGLAQQITQRLPMSLMLPAVGQGALGLEARSDDFATLSRLAALNDPATQAAVTAERALLLALLGGCLAPVGAWGRVDEAGQLTLSAVVLNVDGKQRLVSEATAPLADAILLGQRVADDLLSQGAEALIASARTYNQG